MIAVKRRKRLPVTVPTVAGLYVSYRRTSTGRQTLGVESQAEIIGRYIANNGGKMAADYVEHRSGGDNDRPELAAALAKCREIGATLICAKLDRLSRDVHFIAGLIKHSVPILTCDYPSASTLQLHIVASMAQDERRAIGERTRNALAVAKAKGTQLGANLRTKSGERIADIANAAKSRQASANASAALAQIQSVLAEGMSLRAVARALNERTTTADGYAWSAATVARAIRRAFGEHAAHASL